MSKEIPGRVRLDYRKQKTKIIEENMDKLHVRYHQSYPQVQSLGDSQDSIYICTPAWLYCSKITKGKSYEVWGKPDVSFQQSCPGGQTRQAFNSCSHKLWQHIWSAVCQCYSSEMVLSFSLELVTLELVLVTFLLLWKNTVTKAASRRQFILA